MATTNRKTQTALRGFGAATQAWFREVFAAPTAVQTKAWPIIAARRNALLLAPTGSGKTLASFLVAIDRIQSQTQRRPNRVHTLYISPLKALGVDVERNLRAPIAGVKAVAERLGEEIHVPTVGVRTGDTPAVDRQRLVRHAPDVLITTPESLYLMLTSRAREILDSLETVIIDEIHSMVSGKRGAHLMLTLERLENHRRQQHPDIEPLQRVGLSATIRPLEEVARFLAGYEVDSTKQPQVQPQPRDVAIVEAGRRKQLDLKIEVPVEDMAHLAEPAPVSGSGAASGPTIPSIWPAIQPRLVELIRCHRSTMIFVNSRRLAERLATAINERAEEELAAAHHGSVAKDIRQSIEDRLKRGQLPAIVATSSLELGIDMGAVDLVIQIEAPPTIAAGMQRIGRSGHQVGAPSTGVIFPKYRGDLLACSAAVERMRDGHVEETFYPRNPLDVLAQQIVAMVSLEESSVDEIYATARRAAPFSDLPQSAFEGVLDLLAGRYPSDEFSELRPRINWDRVQGVVAPRRGTQRLAVVNAGTIPDRGLYGVFLADDSASSRRVGELDEEMVFETRAGEVFLLGASSWRVTDITHDRVLVVPAPGEPGRMPFWRGDGPGRPLEFGRAIGKLARRLLRMDRETAHTELVEKHSLDALAATNLLNYLDDQRDATGDVPSDKAIVIESFLDEVGDWRVVMMTPFGSRVHAPWAMATMARIRREISGEVDMLWNDDGIAFRIPECDSPPDARLLVPPADEVEETVVSELGSTALFASHFRENAARALLLPRRQPGRRTPLWLQRRKSADLLKVAAKYERFPMILETFRVCLRDVFDIVGLRSILQDIEKRVIRVKQVETKTPSPFAAALLFNYVGNFVYEGDAPLAERRAASLALDHAQLRELLGDAELRELLDADVVDELALELQRLTPRIPIRDEDSLHEMLTALGDLSVHEMETRCHDGDEVRARIPDWLEKLVDSRRILSVRITGETRYIAVEDIGRFRDALGIAPPLGVPGAFLENVAQPLEDLVSRFARTHVPFKLEDIAQRYGLGLGVVQLALQRLANQDRVLEGEFNPGGRGREWCDANVLRLLKRRSLARLRKQVEPVEPPVYARFLQNWQGLTSHKRGLDGLLDVVEQLQGLPLPASDLERHILPARVKDYHPEQLDELCAAGEIVWQGTSSLGTSNGRVALYLADSASTLADRPPSREQREPDERAILDLLDRHGAVFFDRICQEIGGFRNDVLDMLWALVWSGEVTNDSLAPLRALARVASAKKTRGRKTRFRSRRATQLTGSEGRWSLFLGGQEAASSATVRQTAVARQLLERYGIVTREVVGSEGIVGGFSGIYPVFKAMEEAGRSRRGYFIAGQGAAQFAAPGAEDRLREKPDETDFVSLLAASDPANPYGSVIRWPDSAEGAPRPQRAANARVILLEGRLLAHLNPSGNHLLTFLSDEPAQRDTEQQQLAQILAQSASPVSPMLIAKVDGVAVRETTIAAHLQASGFRELSDGYLCRGT